VSFRLIVSPAASSDVDRLEAWLLDQNPRAAARVGDVLEAAIASLAELPDRDRSLNATTRELNAKFGRSTYVIRYVVGRDQVVVTRIFHGREDR
jgi:plasmid stabilization system protein ParE